MNGNWFLDRMEHIMSRERIVDRSRQQIPENVASKSGEERDWPESEVLREALQAGTGKAIREESDWIQETNKESFQIMLSSLPGRDLKPFGGPSIPKESVPWRWCMVNNFLNDRVRPGAGQGIIHWSVHLFCDNLKNQNCSWPKGRVGHHRQGLWFRQAWCVFTRMLRLGWKH